MRSLGDPMHAFLQWHCCFMRVGKQASTCLNLPIFLIMTEGVGSVLWTCPVVAVGGMSYVCVYEICV